MKFLEFDSSFVSRCHQLTNEPIRSKNFIYYRIVSRKNLEHENAVLSFQRPL
jgi:hypothetical protein